MLFGALLVNLVILYYFWKLQNTLDLHSMRENEQNPLHVGPAWPAGDAAGPSRDPDHPNDLLTSLGGSRSEIAKVITVVVREFEFFENDLSETVQSFLKVLPSVRVVILADAYPYPPLQIPSADDGDVRLVVLRPRVDEPSFVSRPEQYVHTPFVLLVPDSVRLTSDTKIEEMLAYVVTHPQQLAAARVSGENVHCLRVDAKLREWTLELKDEPRGSSSCDAVRGTCVVLASSKLLFELTHPFSRPFPYALFVQTAIRHWKVRVLNKVVFQRGRPLFLSSHSKWKHGVADRERFKMLYEDFGVKKVVPSGGTAPEWYGCNRSTVRCFGTVVNDMPEYLFAKRWTPPCCLQGLRETARHVFKTLKGAGVRYWLEGGSLLGAARTGDIIPWDYDVDVGVYGEDLDKCELLRNAAKLPAVTDDGFVWEKAAEGDFFRVQYSQTNRLHVDIFPFFAKDGVMTKSSWIKSHRQDVEFPERYLRPLTTIRFVGVDASAPNNIREFLELKFGEGVVETLQYPDPKLMPFPNATNPTHS